MGKDDIGSFIRQPLSSLEVVRGHVSDDDFWSMWTAQFGDATGAVRGILHRRYARWVFGKGKVMNLVFLDENARGAFPVTVGPGHRLIYAHLAVNRWLDGLGL